MEHCMPLYSRHLHYVVARAHTCSCKVPVFLILMKIECSRKIFEKYSDINFMQIRPVGAQMFHANRKTNRKADMKKLTVAFRNFTKASNKTAVLHTICRM